MKLRIAKFLLLFYIFSLAYIQPSIRFSGFFLSPSDLIFLLLFGVFSFLIVRGELRLKTDYFYLFIGLYFFTMIASLVFSDFSSRSLIKLLGEAYLISIPVVLMNLIESEEELRLVILCWIAGALIPLIIALISIVAFYLGSSESIFSFSYLSLWGITNRQLSTYSLYFHNSKSFIKLSERYDRPLTHCQRIVMDKPESLSTVVCGDSDSLVFYFFLWTWWDNSNPRHLVLHDSQRQNAVYRFNSFTNRCTDIVLTQFCGLEP